MQANYKEDSRIVLTLDAGGTKFAFSAMAAGDQIVEATETPSHADNLDLSARRAQAVHAHLLTLGIPASQIEWKAFGETRPIADNATEEGRQLNRRVECLVVK